MLLYKGNEPITTTPVMSPAGSVKDGRTLLVKKKKNTDSFSGKSVGEKQV